MTGLVLIGYAWPKRPKVVLTVTLEERQALWKAGYSVDAIPPAQALEIDALFTANGK